MNEFDWLDQEETEVVSGMFSDLVAGTFYKKQEAAAAEMGFTIKYI